MAYFPFFVDIEGQRCLIVGGGTVAYRKVSVLFEYGPEILVISPEMNSQMEEAAEKSEGKIKLLYREFVDEDLEGIDFVVAGTADEGLNSHIAKLCARKRIPVNVVDVRKECSFIFPALIREKDITVGISTGGNSPTIAQYLKNNFKAAIPHGFGELASQLGSYRELVKEEVDELSLRTEILKEMTATGISQGGTLTEEQARELIDKRKRQGETAHE